MSGFLGDQPAGTLTAIRSALGASSEPKITQLPGSDGIVFAPSGRAHTLPAVSVRRHIFHDPQSLASWLLARTDAGSTEILVDETKVVAILDASEAQHDEITCVLTPHPVFARWHAAFGKKLDQKALYSLLRRTMADFRKSEITMPNGTVDRAGAGDALLAAVGKLQTRKDRDFRSELGSAGQTVLKASSEKNEATIDLPDMFEIEVPIFVDVAISDFEHRTIEPRYIIRILVDMDLEEMAPKFTLTAPDLALQLLDARRHVAECLRQKLGEGWTVGLGAAKTQVVLTAPHTGSPAPVFFSLVPPRPPEHEPEISSPDGATE